VLCLGKKAARDLEIVFCPGAQWRGHDVAHTFLVARNRLFQHARIDASGLHHVGVAQIEESRIEPKVRGIIEAAEISVDRLIVSAKPVQSGRLIESHETRIQSARFRPDISIDRRLIIASVKVIIATLDQIGRGIQGLSANGKTGRSQEDRHK
jgi:hypothetical protein